MTEIFVEVRGGVIVESYSDNCNVAVNVIDWDNITDDPGGSSAGVIPCLPLNHMPEETRAAIGRLPRNN